MDFANAEIYADHCTRVYMYEKYLQSHPHIFRYSKLHKEPATTKDYYIPPKIKDKCIISKATFDEIGCLKIACFPKKRNLEPCDSFDNTLVLTLGQQHTFACQPACQFISTYLDTDFRNEKCMISNQLKKSFAMFPDKVDGTKTIQPLHVGFDIKNGNLRINSTYCKYYGLDYKYSTEECFSQPHNTVLETIVGTSFYRSIKRSKVKNKTYPLPDVPDSIKNIDSWLEGHRPRSKRSLGHDIAQDLLREISIDLSIDLTLQQLSTLFKTRIPRTLQAIATNLSKSKMASKITKIALADIVLKSQFNIATVASRTMGAGLSIASGLFTIYGIIALVVDLFDPFNFMKVLDKTTLQKINKSLDFHFYGNYTTQNIEVLPDHVWFLLEEDQSDYFIYKYERMMEYMEALSPDQLIPKVKTQSHEFINVFHVSFIVVFFLLAAILVEYIDYVSFIFFACIFYTKGRIFNVEL